MNDSRPRRSELLSRALSASAGLVAFCALAVSAYQAKIMREQQKMSAWPYVMLPYSNDRGAQLLVQNVGLGPALVRTVEVTFDGRPIRSWDELYRVATLGDTTVRLSARTSDVTSGTVLLPGATVENLRVESPPTVVARFGGAARGDRLVRRVCYCSLYEDCWIADSHLAEPVPVRACAVDSARAFRN